MTENNLPPGADADSIAFILVVLEDQMNKHGILDAARKFALLSKFPEAHVDHAIKVLGQRRKIFEDLEPDPLVEKDTRWYHGPGANGLYWQDYTMRLQSIGWSEAMIETLNASTSKAMDLLDPPGLDKIATRGLVVGRVQSGKTGHFTGLIAKAADSGYRVFIVLSGITNSLRFQTQKRLDRDLRSSERPGAWYWLTKAQIFGDFEYQNEANVDVALRGGRHRAIAVVKKQSDVLRRLIDWLKCGNAMLNRACPILIIDDEADQASLNTGRSMELDELTRINDRIVELLAVFPRCGYVGYTATPFANVLTHPGYPENLYPRSFIFPLSPPLDYFGAERVHGRKKLHPNDSEEVTDGLPLIRIVPDDELPKLKPPGRKISGFCFEVTQQLDIAMRYFFMATAARLFREAKGSRAMDFSTMLLHTSQRVAVHSQSSPKVKESIERLRKEIKALHFGIWESIWKAEMEIIDRDKLRAKLGEVEFKDLVGHLFPALDRCKVIVSNSMRDEETNVTFEEKGQVAIVIGGNTLSRGLTLEGLVVSFFVRSANAYDTILQMGRWFGYRPFYEDLPRIWMTNEMRGHFHDLATIEEEFLDQLEDYRAQGLSPMQAAMRIRRLPKIRITAANKMRFAVTADIGFGGARPQTIHFNPSTSWLQHNLDAVKQLVVLLGEPDLASRGRHVWRNRPASAILAFIKDYQFHPRSRELDRDLLQKYIAKQNAAGGLTSWNVVVNGLDVPREGLGTLALSEHVTTNLIKRSRLKHDDGTTINIKALMDPFDILVDREDFDATRYDGMKARELFAMRKDDAAGVLILYPISKDSKPDKDPSKTRKSLDVETHIMGVAFIFPEGRGHGSSDDYVQADLQPIESVISGEEADDEEPTSVPVTPSHV
jgi:hypothetical protein